MNRYKSRSSLRSSRAGATTIEFAFMVPIIFAMFFGAIEITRLNFIRQTTANAAYEGARKAITPGSTNDEARQEALRLLTMLGVGNGATVTVTSDARYVTVSISVPINSNSWGITRFSWGINVTNSCKLSKETL